MKRKKVRNGIKSGYKQIIKLSETLLSVPVMFTALIVWKKGLALARSVVYFLKNMEEQAT